MVLALTDTTAAVAATPVGGEQADDRGQVITYRPAKGNRHRAQVKRGQKIHSPSLPGSRRADKPPGVPPSCAPAMTTARAQGLPDVRDTE